MAELTKEDILKLAKLSQLKLSDEEVEAYRQELSHILEYVSLLNKVDTKDLKPTLQVTGLSNQTRQDEIVDYGVSQEELLANVPSKQDKYIKTKRML